MAISRSDRSGPNVEGARVEIIEWIIPLRRLDFPSYELRSTLVQGGELLLDRGNYNFCQLRGHLLRAREMNLEHYDKVAKLYMIWNTIILMESGLVPIGTRGIIDFAKLQQDIKLIKILLKQERERNLKL